MTLFQFTAPVRTRRMIIERAPRPGRIDLRMTARSPRIMIATLCCLLAVAASACGKGPAWVLWVHMTGGLHPSGEWEVLEGYKELSECRGAAAANAQGKREAVLQAYGDAGDPFDPKHPDVTYDHLPLEQRRAIARQQVDSNITVSGGYFEMKTMSGVPMVFDYVCLPDTVDPRGPKGK